MSRVLLDLGIFQIKWYSFFVFLAMTVACIIIFKEARKKKIREEYLINLVFYGIIVGLLGARIYYVLFNLEYYLSYPMEIFMIWNGGLAIHGGIIATLIFVIFYSKKEKVNIYLILDVLVVGLILAQAIGRWGNFFNQEAFGRITTLANLQKLYLPEFIIKGMYIGGHFREPTFLYESIFSLLGFLTLLIIRKTKGLKVGQLMSIYLTWYGIERLIIEKFRADSLMLGPVKVAQLVSLIALASGISIFIKSNNNKKLYKDTNFN